MSHELDSYEHYVTGDSIVWAFQIDEDGSKKDLTGATVDYHVLGSPAMDDADALVDHTDAGVSVEVDPSSPEHPNAPTDTTGYVEVRIDSQIVDWGGSTLWHRLKITDGSGSQRTFGGRWFINQA